MGLLGVLLCCLPHCSFAMERTAPFSMGEKLIYRIRWGAVDAGNAVMEVMPLKEVNGIYARHFILDIKTSSFVDIFYKVRDRIEAFTDQRISRSVLYRKKQTGKDKKNVVVQFNWEADQAFYSNDGKGREPIDIIRTSLDPLSVIYGIRCRELNEGLDIYFPVTDGKRCFMGRARVLGRESVKVNGVVYDSFLIEPELTHFGGVFKKSEHPRLKIWVTADEKKIPVKIQCKVLVGSIVGELVAAEF